MARRSNTCEYPTGCAKPVKDKCHNGCEKEYCEEHLENHDCVKINAYERISIMLSPKDVDRLDAFANLNFKEIEGKKIVEVEKPKRITELDWEQFQSDFK